MTATASSGYIAISRRPLDLEDYVDVARRHLTWIVGPLFFGFVASICVAFMLPNNYKSEATMQITPAQISEDLVKQTGNQALTERVISMESTILSRSSLSNLIQSPNLNLYPKERAKQPIEDVIEAMKAKDLRIQLDSAPGTRTHASTFKIIFTYVDRFKAQQTVQMLITRFMDENTSSQRSTQNLLHEFFGDELTQAKAALDKANDELAKFKTENQGRLPEQSNTNIAQLTSFQTRVNGIQDQLNRLNQDRVGLEAHLSTSKNQMDLYQLMAQEPSTGLPGSATLRQNVELESLNKEIESGELRLQQLLQTYRETYPDIRDLKKQLALRKKVRDDLQAKQDGLLASDSAKPKDAPKKPPTNFQAAQSLTALQGEIDKTNAQLKVNASEQVLKAKELETVTKLITEYQNKLAATSGIESHYSDLVREQASATKRYQDMLGKQENVTQQTDLIARKAGENLEVLDSPSIPITPSSPNRYMIVGGGIAASFMLGLVLAGAQEARDSSLKNLKDVRAYTNLPVLCSIPLLENTLLVKRKKRMTYLAWSAAMIMGITAICAALFYYYANNT